MRDTATGTASETTFTPQEVTHDEGHDTERRMGRIVAISTIAAAIFVFTIVAVGMGAVMGEMGGGIALGAFCAAWVGPGFGVIVAGVLFALDHDRALAAERAR